MTIRTLVNAGFVVRKLRLAETVAVFWAAPADANASRKRTATTSFSSNVFFGWVGW
jgi:hypothetical protein